jgi:predicted N-formylglutamate amidohydrolase
MAGKYTQYIQPVARTAVVTSRSGPIDAFLVTCEHGGNRIPPLYRELFRGHDTLLNTHRGYDPGALVMAKQLAAALRSPLVASTVSRLLIDLNRSIGHRQLYSDATRNLPAAVRRQIVAHYYQPYRTKAERVVAAAIKEGRRVIHLSSHSFTPRLYGTVRNADISLLYDPARRGEVKLCERWRAALKRGAPEFAVRRNYPYAGKGDGLTSYLRRCFPPHAYIGIELELNQKHVFAGGRNWIKLRMAVVEALRVAVAR